MPGIFKNRKICKLILISLISIFLIFSLGYFIYSKTLLKNEITTIEKKYLKNYSKRKIVKQILKNSAPYNKNKIKKYIISNFGFFVKDNRGLRVSITSYSKLYKESFSVLTKLKKSKGIKTKDYIKIKDFLSNLEFKKAYDELSYIPLKNSSSDILANKIFLMGILCELNFDFNNAEDLYLQSIELNKFSAKYYNYLARVYYKKYNFTLAVNILSEGLNISSFGNKKDRNEELKLLLNLANNYNMIKDKEQAFSVYVSLLVNATNVNNLKYQWISVYQMAKIQAKKGNYLEAINYLKYSLKLAKKMRSKEYIGQSLNSLSETQYKYGDYTNSKINALKAIKFAKKIFDLDLMADSSLNVCLNYGYLNNRKLAEVYCNRALMINDKLADVLKLPEYYIKNAYIYNFIFLFRDYDKSLLLYQKAYEISKKLNLQIFEANALLGMSKNESIVGDFDESIKLLDEVIKINDKIGVKEGICHGCDYGVTYWRKGDYKSAALYYKKSILEALKNHNNLVISSSARHLAIIYYNLGDYKEALKYSDLALKIDKKIYRYNHNYIKYQEKKQKSILEKINNKKEK